jgi:hypothetical protein
MGEGLVELARRYVAVFDELEGLRGEIRKAVMNGEGGEAEVPFSSAVRRRPGGGAAEQAEQAILELLRDQPLMATGAIARATGAKAVTVQDRLRRLRKRGAISGGGSSGWTAVARTSGG